MPPIFYIYRAAPLVLGCQDKHFLLDEEPARFPKLSPLACFFVDLTLARRHASVWRFNPSNMYGEPRKLPGPPVTTTRTTSIVEHPSSCPLLGYNRQLSFLFFVLLFTFLSAYCGLFKMADSGSDKEKFANFSSMVVDAML